MRTARNTLGSGYFIFVASKTIIFSKVPLLLLWNLIHCWQHKNVNEWGDWVGAWQRPLPGNVSDNDFSGVNSFRPHKWPITAACWNHGWPLLWNLVWTTTCTFNYYALREECAWVLCGPWTLLSSYHKFSWVTHGKTRGICCEMNLTFCIRRKLVEFV